MTVLAISNIQAMYLLVSASDTVITGVIGLDHARLDKALADASGLSREQVKALLLEGRAQIGGQIVRQASARADKGATFRLNVPERPTEIPVPEAIPLTVIYEDSAIIVIDKPAGMTVHPGAGNPDGTLVNALLHHCRGQLSGIGPVDRPGIVHRIDKDTSGLLVAAKTDAAHTGLARQFADHSIERTYQAIVQGHPVPPSGTIHGAIARSVTNRKKMAIVTDGRGKQATTHYTTLARYRDAALMECRLETGRTHQVRVHLTSIGHGLLGDPVYGRMAKTLRMLLTELNFKRQALHATSLGFRHPETGEFLQFSTPMPADMEQLIEKIAT